MGPQFYKDTSFVSAESWREITRWGIEASRCGVEASRWGIQESRWGIQESRWGSEASGNIELSRRRTESSRCGIQASKWGTASSRWDSEASKNIDFSRWIIESSRWGNDHPTSPTSQADASPSPHTSLPTQGRQQHLTPSRLASSAHVMIKQVPLCGLSVKPSRTSESSHEYFAHHKPIRAVSEKLEESNSSNIGHPRMNWNMDLKLITKGGTVPYQATGQVLFESEIHNQENSYFAVARDKLEFVPCESDLDLMPRVPDIVTRTTRSSLDQTSDNVGSAIDITPDVTASAIDLRTVTTKSSLTSDTDGSTIDLTSGTVTSAIDLTSDTVRSAIDFTSGTVRSTIDLTSDTDGSTIDLTSDTDGSTIDLTSDTDGSAIDLTSDTDGSTIDLTSDTDGSTIDLTSDTGVSTTALSPDIVESTDLTLSLRGSHLSVFSSQCKIAGTLPNPKRDSNGGPRCRKRPEIIATPLSGCPTSRGMTTPRREARARPCGPPSDVELSETKHPQIKMEGVCQRKRKAVELENPQNKTPVTKRPLQCGRVSSRARKYINGGKEHTTVCCKQSLEPPPVPRIDPTRAAKSRRAIGQAVNRASPTMSSGDRSDAGGAADACPSVVKRRLFVKDLPSPGHEDHNLVPSI
ncbi:uncharacterized protein LOC124262423 [Haliotis rubra]|uniref:uncharacterized protein LOC124262423 n=1 Tax=Haliotis rubra TaxID=36100 RepID=UPI001EE51069|nr:uncharacterized protein LOC124262423 [Haliotis rubra]